MRGLSALVWVGALSLAAVSGLAGPDRESLLVEPGVSGAFPLVRDGTATPIATSANDWPGVRRAAGDLQADIERVTGHKPALEAVPQGPAVVVGTVGRSELIDGLVARGKLNVDAIRGQWEAFVVETVERPWPGVERALVIAGSDKRGTIYGVYEVSGQIGVSPWYWWADVPPEHRDSLALQPGRTVQTSPSVRYRGIFLNDEAPDLTNWVRAKFGEVTPEANPHAPAHVANYGHEFYARIFELMLRLRANYLWPAMWNNAFNEDDPDNARLADEYGIVIGTSHQEPMLRAQKEWDWRFKETLGSWNYVKNPDVLENFWREGVRRNRNFESLITMGLRGADDTPMAPGGPAANRALLEQIVDRQRGILRAEVNPDVTEVPQVWCLYKEVQEFYDAGMRVPDDVTLLWAEDNWGNLRRLPTTAERGRSGGAGLYYHFDYHGSPRSYQWINTNPLPKIWDQMSMAKGYGADRVWIVNVGHFKGYELPLEYFMSLAWDTGRWGPDDFTRFTRHWAEREFGAAHAADIADIVEKYSKYNGRRKPELLAPDTYSLTDYREAETVVADYRAITVKAEEIATALPENRRDAFYQLVLFPTKASALVNELYLAAGRNALYARQGRASAGAQAVEVRRLFQQFLDLTGHYNGDFAGGKWAHFMDQPVLGYTSWRDPPKNNLDHLKLVEPAVPDGAALGVAVEGAAEAAGGDARLPQFDAFNRERHFVDVFNRGKGPLEFKAAASEPWIQLSAAGGSLSEDQRLWVNVDWNKAPAGKATGTVKISGAGTEALVKVEAFNPAAITRENLAGFVEANGYVSIEPEHYTRATEAGANHWFKISDYGRTLSGLKAWGPVDAPSATPGKDSPCLEYRMYLFTAGQAEVTAITAPTLNFIPDRGVRYAVSFDEEAPQVVTLVPAGWKPGRDGQRDWEKSVEDNAHFGRSTHTLAQPGYHTLKVWMVDPAVVVQKLIVNLGGLKPSYLGPPESFRGSASARPAAGRAPWELSPEERQRLEKLTGEDHADMLRQLRITKLRPGRNGNPQPGTPNPANYDQARANPDPDWPELLVTKGGEKVTTPELWWQKRRPEIAADFEYEVIGVVPASAPKIAWEVTRKLDTTVGGLPVVARQVMGHADNSACPQITVDIKMSVVLPTDARGPVPVLVMFGWGNMPDEPVPRFPGMVDPVAPASPEQLIAAGWGYVSLNTTSIQADNGAGLTAGIIGLANKGQRRTPGQWGALRAWAWGASRALDFLETLPAVNAGQVGIEGVSRYGKAALVAMAFEPRFAIALIGSSGEGGAKPHRRDFGEAVENLTSAGEYHWMAGNFLKYGAAESAFGARTAHDLPVDAHELIALCAPRPVFISYGSPDKGDANWLDQQGSFMATVAAGPAYRLLGAHDLGVTEDYRMAKMPSVNTGLLDGELAWRQHDGGHEDRSNMSFFIGWADQLFKYRAPARNADQPVMRGDRNSHLGHAQLLEKAKAGGISVYFLGDSITRRWGATDYPEFLAHWKKNFHGWNAADFGWGADGTQNMLWRLQNGELDGVNPKVIVLLAGTNNVGKEPGDEAKVADVTRGITALVNLCRAKAPRATIILMGIFPRNDGPVVPTINRINANLAKLADGRTVRYLNINDRLADPDGKLFDGMTMDRLHPSLKGYQIWAEALKPVFTELLGPPAENDTAPPPTGDPSAQR
jgi:lysophospholipase L1-like esterase